MESNTDKRVEIDINELIVNVYNKVAVWVNESAGDNDKQKSDYLKLVSADIVETCLEELTKQISNSSGIEHKQPEEVDKKTFSLFKRKVKPPNK